MRLSKGVIKLLWDSDRPYDRAACKGGYRRFGFIFKMNLRTFLITAPVPRKRKDFPRRQGDDMIWIGYTELDNSLKV
ncbi:MAG: hypothetical protein DF221_00545 [Brevibacillus sp.]|nr:MAG: hypothetical protein DF221_00545 [Brevibacillus sp.]